MHTITHYTVTRQDSGAVYVGLLPNMTDAEAAQYVADGEHLYGWDCDVISAEAAEEDKDLAAMEPNVVHLYRQRDHVLLAAE